MPSSWFPKPVYKQIRRFSLLFLFGFALLGVGQSIFWYIGIAYIFVWSVLLIFASTNIRSGVFIKSINAVANGNNSVFLTFDDGPVEQTEKILDLLIKYEARASFFCIGKQVEQYPDTVKRIVSEGHSIGNHSYTHRSMFPLFKAADIKAEIQKTQDVIKQISGCETHFFRPPFGITNPLIAEGLRDLKLIPIGWSIRSFDTSTKDKDRVIKRILNQIKSGSIILLHDTVPYSVELLEEVLILCREKNLLPIALHEAIKPEDYE